MNWLDGIIVIFLLFFAFEGFRKSFLAETLNFLSFLLALFLSLRFYDSVATIIEQIWQFPQSFANVLGFIIVWFFVEMLFFVLIRLTFRPTGLSLRIDKALSYFSVIPALLRGLVFISIILVVIGTFPVSPRIKQSLFDSVIGSFMVQKTVQLEQPLKNVFGGVTTDSLNFLTVKPLTHESIDLGFKTDRFEINETLEFNMIDLVNMERSKQGLKILTFDSKLRPAARIHSEDMLKRGYFSHYSPEGASVANRAEKYKIDYLVIGENLAFAPDLQLAHTGLMNSPGHRANILSKEFHKIGIGIADSGIYGLMITQVFSD